MMTEEVLNQKTLELDREILALENQKTEINCKLKALKQEKESLQVEYSFHKIKSNQDKLKWSNAEFEWTKQVYDLLKTKFKFDEFKTCQLAAINATLAKKDVLVILPTGGGKSLIYQLASLVTGDLSVVISPLLALIDDQIMALQKIDISAASLNSNTPSEEKNKIISMINNNTLRIIFVTPEWMAKSKAFLKLLNNLYKEGRLARFIIDEVHCCSQWGHDFRTDYMSLSLLRGQYASVPILGLTATATMHILMSVQKILQIPEAVIITSPYNRPNLYYEVVYKSEDKHASVQYIEVLMKNIYKGQSGIIYAGTQRECESLATELRNKDLKVAPYHAQMSPASKRKIHKKWVQNSYQAVVATIAFGMGIDKPDVRFVIHYSVPKSIEGLYQESGRAGRDGEKADCILMFNLGDWLKMVAIVENARQEKLMMSMLEYCIDTALCRRKIISKYFDDDWRTNDCQAMCDHCRNSYRAVRKYDVRPCLNQIVKIIDLASLNEVNLTLKKLLNSWFQEGPKNLQLSCEKPRFSTKHAEYIIAYFLVKNLLIVRRGYSLLQTLPYIDTNFGKEFDYNTLQALYMDYAGTIIKGLDIVDPDVDTSGNSGNSVILIEEPCATNDLEEPPSKKICSDSN